MTQENSVKKQDPVEHACTLLLLYVSRPGGQVCEELCLQGLPDTKDPSGQAQDQGYLCGMIPLYGAGCSEEFRSNII